MTARHCPTCTCDDIPSFSCTACHANNTAKWDVHGYAEKVRAGEMYCSEVAREVGVSRQAVEQAFGKHKVKNVINEGADIRRSKREEEREKEKRERADQPRKLRDYPLKITNEFMLQSIRSMHEFLKLGDSGMPHALYAELRPKHLPSSSAITDRFGSWNEACKAAGIPFNEPIRDNYTKVSRERVLDDVRRYVIQYRAEAGRHARISNHRYDLWARNKENKAISRATIAKRFNWSTILNEVLTDLYGGTQDAASG